MNKIQSTQKPWLLVHVTGCTIHISDVQLTCVCRYHRIQRRKREGLTVEGTAEDVEKAERLRAKVW